MSPTNALADDKGGVMEDVVSVNDPKVWRTGPAKFIYDQLGIPEDTDDLDYSIVFEQQEDEENVIVEVDAELQRQLDLAIQSILPQDDAVYDTAAGSRDKIHESINVFGNLTKVETEEGASWGLNQQDSPDKRRLKKLGMQIETAEAVTALQHEIVIDHQDDSLYCRSDSSDRQKEKNIDDDISCLVSQLQWEDDIIWDVPQNFQVPKHRQSRAGWIPSLENREAPEGFQSMLECENRELISSSWEDDVIWNAAEFRKKVPQPKLPVFDVTDDEIVFHKPTDTRVTLPERQQVTCITKKSALQPHTMKSKLILGKTGFLSSTWRRERLEQQARKVQEKTTTNSAENVSTSQPDIFKHNLCEIAHDKYYGSREISTENRYTDSHSRLVLNLVQPFMPTHLNTDQLRNFHRPKLLPLPVKSTDANRGKPIRHDLKSLTGRIQRKFKDNQKLLSSGQRITFDQEIDLSGRDGTIILVENCEEHPPLLSQVGMCSQIVNYYKRKSLKEEEYAPPLPHPFGVTNYVSSSSFFPFLGTLESGQVLSSICNNMYQSPIYWHDKNETDFLIIRSKASGYMIRDLDGLFVAGQQCPQIEVPEPNSNKAKAILKDFVQAFVYHKYRALLPKTKEQHSGDIKIRLDMITKHFPTLPDNYIKAILKNSSEVKRIGNVTWLVKKPEFSLPEEEDLHKKAKVENICAFYSLLAGEQRLRDAGLDSLLSLPDRGQDDVDGNGKKGRKSGAHSNLTDISGATKLSPQQSTPSAFHEELLSAPWNTTAAFLAAADGKCFLQVNGPADPTGCGEGYSYVRVPKRGAAAGGSDAATPLYSGRGRPRKYPPKTGGTDADLRKLSAKTAKDLLNKAGVPEKEIQKLTRWEVIDLVRTLSTEKVMQGETIDSAIKKFCRWKSAHTSAMNQDRYREDCQRVFELQNKVLSSKEILSTDEEDSDDDETVGAPRRVDASQKDIEQMGRNIERILYGDADINRLTHEEEELERLELQKMMLGEIKAKDADIAKRKEALEREKELAQKSKENSEDILTDLIKHPRKVLKLTRTFSVKEESFTRTEIVRDPVVIAAYLRIRNSKSEEFIKQFLQKAERREKKEQKQKDRMLLGKIQHLAQVEERKVNRMQSKRKREMEDEYFPNKEAKKEAEKILKRKSRKCGMCGLPGHMKTSKECPMYNQEAIEKMLKKRETKKLKLDQKNIRSLPLPAAPAPASNDREAEKENLSSSDSEDSSETTSSSDDFLSSSSELDSDEDIPDQSQSTESAISSQEEPIVKTDGLKMFVKKSSIQDMIIQAREQEAKEQEVARILAEMANETLSPAPGSVSRRRVSQAERENADYLNDRKYRTTAADRRSAKC